MCARRADARVARLDRDTVRRRGAIARLLQRSRARARRPRRDADDREGPRLPAVTLVGVISADVGLGFADFRAAERTFQLLTQVVGRAGRGARPGEAMVQTLYPDHYASAACASGLRRVLRGGDPVRRAMHYPPKVSLINVVVSGPSPRCAEHHAIGVAAASARQTRRRPFRRAWTGGGSAPAPAGRAPRAGVREGDVARGDAAGGAAARWRRTRRWRAGRPSSLMSYPLTML